MGRGGIATKRHEKTRKGAGWFFGGNWRSGGVGWWRLVVFVGGGVLRMRLGVILDGMMGSARLFFGAARLIGGGGLAAGVDLVEKRLPAQRLFAEVAGREFGFRVLGIVVQLVELDVVEVEVHVGCVFCAGDASWILRPSSSRSRGVYVLFWKWVGTVTWMATICQPSSSTPDIVTMRASSLPSSY